MKKTYEIPESAEIDLKIENNFMDGSGAGGETDPLHPGGPED